MFAFSYLESLSKAIFHSSSEVYIVLVGGFYRGVYHKYHLIHVKMCWTCDLSVLSRSVQTTKTTNQCSYLVAKSPPFCSAVCWEHLLAPLSVHQAGIAPFMPRAEMLFLMLFAVASRQARQCISASTTAPSPEVLRQIELFPSPAKCSGGQRWGPDSHQSLSPGPFAMPVSPRLR